jgi:hypothetical protein
MGRFSSEGRSRESVEPWFPSIILRLNWCTGEANGSLMLLWWNWQTRLT